MEGGNVVVAPRLIPLLKLGAHGGLLRTNEPRQVAVLVSCQAHTRAAISGHIWHKYLRANWPRQVAVDVGVGETQVGRGIVLEHPGKHGVLREVVVESVDRQTHMRQGRLRDRRTCGNAG